MSKTLPILPVPALQRPCLFSPCRRYRYTLWRKCANDPSLDTYVQFIGLNPSTADDKRDDPTVKRCTQYARRWGYGWMCMTNIFAYRATDPKEMLRQDDPIGPGNDAALLQCYDKAALVIAAWGTHGAHLERGQRVMELLPKMHCLRLTKGGHPSHPLYLHKALDPIPLTLR